MEGKGPLEYQHYRDKMVLKTSLSPCAMDESSLSIGRVRSIECPGQTVIEKRHKSFETHVTKKRRHSFRVKIYLFPLMGFDMGCFSQIKKINQDRG